MQHLKATAWGAGLMGMAGLAGALLGPSPLVLPLAPLVGIAYAPFMLATAALGIPCQTCAERFADQMDDRRIGLADEVMLMRD